MATDNNEVRDDLSVTLNDQDVTEAPGVGSRPSEGAPKARWATYAESLGLDLRARDFSKTELMGWVDGVPVDDE